MYDYCNLGHYIWLNPSPSKVPTSGDLKSGDCLFFSTTNIKHPSCPHNHKSTQTTNIIMTWAWLRTLYKVSHKLQTVKHNEPHRLGNEKILGYLAKIGDFSQSQLDTQKLVTFIIPFISDCISHLI